MESRAAECSTPQGAETTGGHSEVDGGGYGLREREGMAVCRRSDIRRGEVVDAFECLQEDLNSLLELTGSQWSCCRTGAM